MKRRIIGIVATMVLLVVIAAGSFGLMQQVRASELEGTADNVSSRRLFIDGRTIIITDNTTIKGEFTSGARVEIKAEVLEDGNLVATDIKVKQPREQARHKSEIKGVIDSVQLASDNVTPTAIVINGQTVQVNPDTRIVGTLTAGATAEVETMTVDGTMVAIKIKIEADGDEEDIPAKRRNEDPERNRKAWAQSNHGMPAWRR